LFFADVRFFAKLCVTLTVTQHLASLYEPNMSGIFKLYCWSERQRSIACFVANIKTVLRCLTKF